jgi:hypothetical protein
MSRKSFSAGWDTSTLYFATSDLLLDFSCDLRKRTFPAFLDSFSALIKQTIQFEFAIEPLKDFNAHDYQIATPILGDKDRLTVLVAEGGYFVVVVSQVCAGCNVWHDSALLSI